MSDIGDSNHVPWRERGREDDQKCKLAAVPVEEIRSGGQRQSFKVQWYSAVGTLSEISSQIGTKLRDWAVWQARASCYSQAALFSNDSKTRY